MPPAVNPTRAPAPCPPAPCHCRARGSQGPCPGVGRAACPCRCLMRPRPARVAPSPCPCRSPSCSCRSRAAAARPRAAACMRLLRRRSHRPRRPAADLRLCPRKRSPAAASLASVAGVAGRRGWAGCGRGCGAACAWSSKAMTPIAKTARGKRCAKYSSACCAVLRPSLAGSSLGPSALQAPPNEEWRERPVTSMVTSRVAE
jgi:hypothetical protein